MNITRPATSPVLLAIGDATRSRQELIAENMMQRRQLIIATRNPLKRHWPITQWDRAVLVALASVATYWREGPFSIMRLRLGAGRATGLG